MNKQPLITENKEMIGELTIVKNTKQTNNNNNFNNYNVISPKKNEIIIFNNSRQKSNYNRNENSPKSKYESNKVKVKKINSNLNNSTQKDKDRMNNFNRNINAKQIQSTSNIFRNHNERSLDNLKDIINNSEEIYENNKLNNISNNKNLNFNNGNNNFNINQNIIYKNEGDLKELRQIENELKNQNELNKRIQNKNNEQENMIYQLNQEINKLKMDNKNKDNEIIMLKNNINEKYQNSINQLQNEIKRLQNENNIIREENTKLKNELINNKVNSPNNNNALRDKELVIMNQNLQEYKIIINKLEKENKEKENIIKNLEIINKNKSDEFQNILKEKENEINNIKTNINNKNIENDENINNIIISKNKEILQLKEQNQKIYLDFQNQMRLNKKYKNKINELKNELNEMNKSLSNYKSDKEEEVNKRMKEISEKEKEFNRKMNFLEDKENQIEKENNNLKYIRIKIQKDIELNKILRKENSDLNIKKNELEKEINIMKNNNQLLNNKVKKNKFHKIDNNIIFRNDIQLNNTYDNSLNQNNMNNQIQLEKKFKQEQDILNKKLENEPIMLYYQPTLVGLNNIGATCFMNATLQCLSQTEALTNYFLNRKNKNKIINNNIALKNRNELQLSPVYRELVKKLWEVNGPKSFSPNNFMNIINTMNPLFKKGLPGDSKDFIIFILEQLHKELKKPIKFNNKINVKGNLNQYDRNNAFCHFFNEFIKETSIISDIFFGFNETTNECLYCKNRFNLQGFPNPICYNYGIFNCLIFPLEEVKRQRNNLIQFGNFVPNNINKVSLYECFLYNQNSEYFTGQNQNFCNICKQTFDSIYTSKIYVSPNVLVLILNRGKGNIYNVKLDFTEKIDITPFVSQREMIQITYDLYGVITHIGQSGPNAHFMAACKSPVDKKWYRYNDAIVSPITNIQKDVIDFGTPYILFYQKNNN